MQDRIDPRDEADLLWLFNDCEGELKRIPSMHEAVERRAHFDPIRRDQMISIYDRRGHRVGHYGGLRGGPIYVGTVKPDSRSRCDPLLANLHTAPSPFASRDGSRAIAAAGKERRMKTALAAAGAEAAEVLRLRFREVLAPARIPFGLSGRGGARAGGKLTLLAVRLAPLRGAGAVAHLTRSARAAHATAVKFGVKLELGPWVDRLGLRLDRGNVTPAERLVGRAIAREADALVLAAWKRYRRAYSGAPRLRRPAAPPELARAA